MTQRFRSTAFILIVAGAMATLFAGIALAVREARGIRVGSAVVSQILCSGVFVSGLDQDRLYAEAVKPIPGQTLLSKRLKYVVDRPGRQVVATWAGVVQSRAVYRDGLGCMVVHRDEWKSANEFHPSDVAVSPPAPLEIQPRSPELETALDRAFAEPAQPPYRRVKAIVILHHGKLVAERYAPGYGTDTPILGYSLAKSVTNALVGILVRQGKLSVAQRAPIAEWSSPYDPRHNITVDQLLRMTSGLDLAESDSGFDPVSRMLFLESDMARYAERAPLDAAPGSEWDYSSGNYMILSRIIRDAVGGRAQDVVEFARIELFEPLGINTATIEFDATGTPVGCIYVLASARDWARFGALYLNDGVVNGHRILPAGWVNYSASPTLGTDYGAGFWTNRGSHGDAADRIQAGMPENAFYGSGNLGQRLVIIPSKDLIIVRFGFTHSPGFDIRGLLRLVADTSSVLN